ncbi:MAG: proton-conducting membrane transporter [Lachnospiraceae bacterium]|nr:proton-conducting membrane transporter [Lachnospiraceae bacterium]
MVGLSNLWYLALILLPIIGGIGVFLIPFKKRSLMCIYVEVITVLTSLLSFFILFNRPEGQYKLVTFVEKFSIAFAFDGMGTIFAGLISFLWPLASLYAFEYMKHEVSEHSCKETTFFGFYTMTFGVTLGIASAANLLTMYIFYEMLTLVTVPLIIFSLSREATLATRTYLYYSLGGAAFGFVALIFLSNFGVNLDFSLGGVLNFDAVSDIVKVPSTTLDASHDLPANVLRLIYLFGFFGFGVKTAVWPLSSWLPKAGVAPTPVTALLHAVAVVKSGAFAILRITYFSFGTDVLKGTFAQFVPMAIVIFTIVYGCSQAVRERHFKRRLAYSTVSNLSYILFGALIMSPIGMIGALSHMLFHGVMKICSFFCAGAVITRTGKEYVYELDGLGKTMPKTFAAFTISSFALMGVPGLCGFISKFNLARGAVESGNVLAYIGVGALLVSALLTAIYMLQVVIRAYFPEKGFNVASVERYSDPGWQMLVPFGIFIITMVYFGLFSDGIVELLNKVAMGLF